MQVKYKDVELLAVVPHNFTDKQGVEVEYNECYFETKDDNSISSVIVLNTKQWFLDKVRDTGTLTIEIDPTNARKPKLINFEVEA